MAANAFVTELNATGTALIYSTYLGGSGDDTGYGIAVDGTGNAYVTGSHLLHRLPHHGRRLSNQSRVPPVSTLTPSRQS